MGCWWPCGGGCWPGIGRWCRRSGHGRDRQDPAGDRVCASVRRNLDLAWWVNSEQADRGVVDRAYADKAPFAFTGTIKKVTFDIKPHLSGNDAQALHESAHHGHVAHGISG